MKEGETERYIENTDVQREINLQKLANKTAA